MIERLIASGHAYEAEHHVLFSVSRYAEYGKLSRRSIEEQMEGARVEVAAYKADPNDFVLWKPSPPELPGWDSPWGRGRPGWHIECSAMTEAYLGETIDIHAGGNDLRFPHHENEIAQSECAHGGKTFARYWVHNGFVNFSGRKMSKSLGNTLLVHDLRQRVPPEALRLLLLSAHYRQPLDWSDTAVDQAVRTLDRLYGVLRDLAPVQADAGAAVPEALEAALCDDLNTPVALAELSRFAGEARKAEGPAAQASAKSALLAAGRALNLLQQTPEAWFAQRAASNEAIDEAKVEDLVARRDAAKKARDFAQADAIRAELSSMGVVLEDTPQGVRWRRAKSDEAALAR
jgi:cysteinyl-tRNA synthetase